MSPHLQPCAGARAGFVFICPGRFEASRGFPCAAGTGANLARALLRLHARMPARFQAPDRTEYVITNSWERVEYPALTGRSVPSEQEVLTPVNLARLAAELGHLSTIVACGAQAQAAVRALVDLRLIAADVAYARHLSQRSVNMIPGATDTPGRIEAWCDGVLGQLADRP
ncbi:MAG: hypothetical protein Q8K96_04090 [Rubrivivax sp.]|nr:hypothetical protein [Rubrivivax sp.]